MTYEIGDRVRYTKDKIKYANWDFITYGHADLDLVVRVVERVEPHRLWCQYADSPVDLSLDECSVVLAADVEPERTDWIGSIAAVEHERETLASFGVRVGSWEGGRFVGCALDEAARAKLEPHWGWWTWSLSPAGEVVGEGR